MYSKFMKILRNPATWYMLCILEAPLILMGIIMSLPNVVPTPLDIVQKIAIGVYFATIVAIPVIVFYISNKLNSDTKI